jgi:hypothetical protein
LKIEFNEQTQIENVTAISKEEIKNDDNTSASNNIGKETSLLATILA